MLAVGALFRGQASFSTEISRTTSDFSASVECRPPVKPTIGTPNLLIKGRRFNNSPVSPLFEIAITTSCLVIIPESPWVDSAGWRNTAGVPVEHNVAAIFLPIRPDLPMPVTTTLPLQEYKISIALLKSAFSLFLRARMEFASISKTSIALEIKSSLLITHSFCIVFSPDRKNYTIKRVFF